MLRTVGWFKGLKQRNDIDLYFKKKKKKKKKKGKASWKVMVVSR
jgi:hypothetical protein